MYSSAVRGLQAATSSLLTSAKNVARESSAPSTASRSEQARSVGDPLIHETISQLTAASAFKSNLKTLQTAQEMERALPREIDHLARVRSTPRASK